MEFIKRCKSAMVTIELVISLVLVVVVLFVTLGLFSDNLKGVFTTGNFQNIFNGNGAKTLFSAFNKDYSSSQVSVMVMSDQGLEVLRKKANDAALKILQDGVTDSNKDTLAYLVSVIKIIDGNGGNVVIGDYTVGVNGTNISVTGPHGTITAIATKDMNPTIKNGATNKEITLAIANMTNDNINNNSISGLALVQNIKTFTTSVAVAGGGGNSASISSAESAIIDLVTVTMKANVEKFYTEKCGDNMTGANESLCADLLKLKTTEIKHYADVLGAKYNATSEALLISGNSEKVAQYWESWSSSSYIQINNKPNVVISSNNTEVKIATENSSSLIAEASGEPIIAGASDALIRVNIDNSSVYKDIDNTLIATFPGYNLSNAMDISITLPNYYSDYVNTNGGKLPAIEDGNGPDSSSAAYCGGTYTLNHDYSIPSGIGYTIWCYNTYQDQKAFYTPVADELALKYAWEFLKNDNLFEVFSKDPSKSLCASLKKGLQDIAHEKGAIEMYYITKYDKYGCQPDDMPAGQAALYQP